LKSYPWLIIALRIAFLRSKSEHWRLPSILLQLLAELAPLAVVNVGARELDILDLGVCRCYVRSGVVQRAMADTKRSSRVSGES
jgi:hypothetical protein